MMLRNDLPDIKQGLMDRIVEVCAALLPQGKREGRLWVSHNPFVNEARKEPALKVALTGDKGAWTDWRNGRGSYKGDVIGLVEFCNSVPTGQALMWARDFLGMRNMTQEQRNELRRAAETRVKREIETNEKKRAFKIEKAQELFFKGTTELGRGSAAELHALAYLEARGLDLLAVPNLSQKTFRFSSETEYWKGATWSSETGRAIKTKQGPLYPAIHSAMRQASGAITCCHVTFLDPVKPAKAPVSPPKLMFGEALGAVIEISCGPSGLDFWDANAAPAPVVIEEGMETGVSIAGEVHEARNWAAGSLSGMGHCPVHLPCVSEIIVARDNNTGNAQAQQHLFNGLSKLEACGKPLVVMNSHVGDDFNDLMTGEE
jgi:Toprim domain